MKTKWMLTGLIAVALGVAAFGMTGCKPSQPDNTSQVAPDNNTAKPAPDTSTNQAAQEIKTNQAAPEIKASPKVQYTCSMHPEVIQDAPGRCPKCGMKLIEKK